jgi:hypothetical protein
MFLALKLPFDTNVEVDIFAKILSIFCLMFVSQDIFVGSSKAIFVY